MNDNDEITGNEIDEITGDESDEIAGDVNDEITDDETVSMEFDDELFSISITGNMELRNFLRAGLVEAQEKDRNKTPLLVSWPEWLEDGIVCLYARDFRDMLDRAVHETAKTLMMELDAPDGEKAEEAEAAEPATDVGEEGSFTPLDVESLPKAEQ